MSSFACSLAIALFFAVLFFQSGVDKIVDRKGNLEWMTPHFANSPLKNGVPLALTLITLLEMLTGLAAVISIVIFIAAIVTGSVAFIPLLQICSAMPLLTLLVLFTGQRLAKDYAGAATLAIYFAVAVFGMVITGGYYSTN